MYPDNLFPFSMSFDLKFPGMKIGQQKKTSNVMGHTFAIEFGISLDICSLGVRSWQACWVTSISVGREGTQDLTGMFNLGYLTNRL